MGVPIGLALLFFMAIGPALPWRAATGEVLRSRLLIPAWVGGLTLVACVVGGARGIANVAAFALGAFALASVGRSVVVGVRARKRAASERVPVALLRTVRSNPRLYGGLLVHVGVVVLAIGLTASSGYTTKREVRLSPGESTTVRGYTVTFLRTETEETRQKSTVRADVRIRRGTSDLGVYSPAISSYPDFPDGIGTPSVHTGPLHDVYLTLVSAPRSERGAAGPVTLGVQVGTLVMWLWVGGAIMGLGTVVALTPTCRRRVIPDASVATDEPRALAEVAP
jgi:cytochrome c-type biogenesis protein CcmF